MLLSKIEEHIELTDNFSLNIRNGKMFFTIDGKVNKFGSKEFPLGSRGQSLFTSATTENGDYDNVAKVIENSNWEHKNGYCYTNAEVLHHAFVAHGIEAKYYSGWVFTSPQYPIHHAWVVVDDNVYDIGINMKSQQKLIEVAFAGGNPYSDKVIKEIKKIEANPYPIQDHFIWGKVNDPMIYVGSEETPTSARMKFNKCMDMFPNHSSYANMNRRREDGKHFQTKLQKMLLDE